MTYPTIDRMRNLRQSRRFTGERIDDATLNRILEIAQWTGSSNNRQPWHLIVIEDREQLKRIAHVRELNSWAENAAVAIAIVTDNDAPTAERYDEGRMTERIMLAADELGLGSGTAWFSRPELIAEAKKILGVPEGKEMLSMVVIGHVSDDVTQRGMGSGGRKPLSEILSYNSFGHSDR